MSERIALAGRQVQLRSTTHDDGPALIAIRSTEAVRDRWRGDDLGSEFEQDLEDDELVQLTIAAVYQWRVRSW